MDMIEQYMSLFCGRLSDHSVQLETGLYARAGLPLDRARVAAHLRGEVSLATYVLDEHGQCKVAVLDGDKENDFFCLADVQQQLLRADIPAWLERSRRGGHLWVFLAAPAPASIVRAWLLPFCPSGMEFFPKQDVTRGVGSAIRLPFGIHRRSGRRYSFVTRSCDGQWHAVGSRISDQVAFLFDQARAIPPLVAPDLTIATTSAAAPDRQKKSFSLSSGTRYASIREWNAAHNPLVEIGRYVDLDRQGAGHCPFGEHHEGGRDHHHSFQVYEPHQAGGYCWLCHAGGVGGSLFDFLARYHGLTAGELWRRIQRGDYE
jgi:hypothetical protein